MLKAQAAMAVVTRLLAVLVSLALVRIWYFDRVYGEHVMSAWGVAIWAVLLWLCFAGSIATILFIVRRRRK